jgi:C4-type Zn-finger protein
MNPVHTLQIHFNIIQQASCSYRINQKDTETEKTPWKKLKEYVKMEQAPLPRNAVKTRRKNVRIPRSRIDLEKLTVAKILKKPSF